MIIITATGLLVLHLEFLRMVPIVELCNESVEQDPCPLLLSPLLKVSPIIVCAQLSDQIIFSFYL